MKTIVFDYIISKLNLSTSVAYSILDFGCGTGDFLELVSKNAGVKSKLFGVDASEGFIRAASERYPAIAFVCEKFDGKLEFPDASCDLITTIDVVECVSKKDALINEFHRILKPGGIVLAAHWDWDTMVYHSGNKDIARKVVSAFSDWKQPWMDSCGGQMGRKLWGLFEGSGKFRGRPDSFNLIETAYEKGTYGFDRMQDIARIVGKGGIERDEYDKLHSELTENSMKGQYFFSVTSFIYYGGSRRT